MPSSERQIRMRRLLPWGAVLLLFVLDVVAGRAGDAQAKAEAKPVAARSGDVKDTHQRLDEIYKRLGIKRQEVQAESESEGCSCRRRPVREESRRPEPSPRPGLSAPAMPSFLGYLLIAAVILAMLVPLYLSLRSSYQRSSREPEPEPEEEEPEAPQEVRGPWRVNLAECRRLFEAGRLPEAFAALHRVFLVGLGAQRHLVLDGKTTNWEYVRRLSSRPQLRQTLAAVTVAAEASVLGQHPPTREHYIELEKKVVAANWEALE